MMRRLHLGVIAFLGTDLAHEYRRGMDDAHLPAVGLPAQTGLTEQQRRAFLNNAYREAIQLLVQRWKPAHEHEPAF
jgi:hypothetical protein